MKFNLQSHKAGLITLLAMAVLAICLSFAVLRLFDVERDLRSEDTHTNLWQISQTQFEAALLAESLARYAGGEALDGSEHAPDFRMAILISRLGVLLEGPQGQIIGQVSALGDLKAAYLLLTLAEPLMERALTSEEALHLRGRSVNWHILCRIRPIRFCCSTGPRQPLNGPCISRLFCKALPSSRGLS